MYTDRPFSSTLDLAVRTRLIRANQLWSTLVYDARFKELYPAFLIQTYHYIRQSCPLMQSALKSLVATGSAPRCQAFLRQHLEEEKGHDEWVLEDLQGLEVSRLSVAVALPLPAVVGLVGSQMYLIEHVSPVALLGYMYVLEAYPQSQRFLGIIEEQHGIARTRITALSHHSEIDHAHREELLSLLDDAAFSNEERQGILHSALMTADLVCRFYEELLLLIDVSSVCDCVPHLSTHKEATCRGSE